MFGFIPKLVCEFSETLAKDGLDGNGLPLSNSLIIQKPKTKKIMHRDVFGYLMKNSSFLHP